MIIMIKLTIIKNKITKKIIFFLLFIFFILVVIFLYGIYSICEKESKTFILKNNSNIRIDISTVNCGALNANSAKLYLTSKDDKLNLNNYILFVDGYINDFQWLNNQELKINISSRKIIENKEFIHINGIKYSILLDNNY